MLSLLSHDRGSHPLATFSHETALALHDLSDANPAYIHLTAPPSFRRQLPNGIVIHRGVVPPADWEARDGYHVTTALRTLLDIAASPPVGHISSPLCAMSCAVGSGVAANSLQRISQ